MFMVAEKQRRKIRTDENHDDDNTESTLPRFHFIRDFFRSVYIYPKAYYTGARGQMRHPMP